MKYSLFVILFLSFHYSFAQKITYAAEGSQPLLKSGFNIIGKIDNQYLVHIGHYVNSMSARDNFFTYDKSYFYLYNDNMQLVSAEKLDFKDDYYGIQFICYPKFAYMFYQYTHDYHSYCSVIKIDSMGKVAGKPFKVAEMEISQVYSNTPVFNIAYSEDKNKIAVFSVENSRHAHVLKLYILNTGLKRIDEKEFQMEKMGPHEILTEFKVTNKGDFVFLKENEDNYGDPFKYILNYTLFNSSELVRYNITPHKLFLNKPAINIDNKKNEFTIFSFFADSSLNILADDISIAKAIGQTGVYYLKWSIDSGKLQGGHVIPFENFIDADSVTPEFSRLAVQSLVLQHYYRKSSNGFLLQGTSVYPNTYKSNFETWQNAADNNQLQFLNYDSLDFSVHINRQNEKEYRNENLLFYLFDDSGYLSKFSSINRYKPSSNILINSRDGIHCLFFYNHGRNYAADHYLIRNSGEISKLPPLDNIGDHEIISTGSLQVDQRELIFPFIYGHKLNFGKMEF
ncbi:MAG TPA: hypothetical protein VMT76_10710 [Puia sp.]|nr:hypothetical protein [Puia sp.]